MKLKSQELRSKRLLYPNAKSKNMLYVKNVG